MAIDFAMREELCLFHGARGSVRPDDALVFPLSKSAVVQVLPGASELTLFHGDKEISFETPGQIAFAARLAQQSRFRAGDALGWTDLEWPEIADMVEELIAAGVLARAEDFDGAAAIEREDHESPLPPAIADAPHSWREPDLMRALTGRDLERGYLEAVVPIFRVAHPCLDAEGRQVGEGNVFPKALRLDVPTQWRTCTYSGTRYQPAKPMNVAALKAMRVHWREMMVVLREMRATYLRRFPQAEGAWTVGHVERLATLVLALPSWLLMREEGAIANGALHPVLSNLFRVTDGLRMAVHQMMFVPVETMLDPETPTSAAEIFAYAERNYSFHSEHGVCAGPQFMIEDFLAVLIDGAAPKGGWPARIDPAVEDALGAIEPAIDYGLLGLKSHAAAFSLWPAMARAYDAIAAALDHAGSPVAEAFAAHRARMRAGSYLAHEPWRRHREGVYAEMWASCSAAVRGARPRPAFLADREASFARAETEREIRAIVEDSLGPRAAAPVAQAIAAFALRGQAVVRAVEAAQAEINRLLGRPAPQRPLTLRDLDVHNKLITGQERSLAFLPDELDRLLGLAIDCDATRIRIDRGSGQPFDGDLPIEAQRASGAQTQGD